MSFAGTKVLADFNIKLLFSDVCKKRNADETMTAEEVWRIHETW